MAKKSNKTDHVLGLLSNAGVGEDSLKKIRVPSEKSEKELVNPPLGRSVPKEQKNSNKPEHLTRYTLPKESEQIVQVLAEQLNDNKQERVMHKKLQIMQNKPEQAEPPEETEQEATPAFKEKRSIYSHLNIVEDVVARKAKEIIEQLDICKCDRCYKDILSLALNQLPTYYVVVLKGTTFPKISTYEKQNSVHVIAAVTRACMVVKNNPNH